MEFTLIVNGVRLSIDPPEADEPLLYLLRELGYSGPRYGCGLAQCGACMVLKDGQAIPSCVTPAVSVAGAEITTAEGIGDGPLRQAFLDEQAGQCGYCLSGMIVAAAALLKANPRPTEPQIRAALEWDPLESTCRHASLSIL